MVLIGVQIFSFDVSRDTTVRPEQRVGAPCDFRRDILITKPCRVPRWEAMKQKNDRMLRCQNKDIHLVPVQFLFYI